MAANCLEKIKYINVTYHNTANSPWFRLQEVDFSKYHCTLGNLQKEVQKHAVSEIIVHPYWNDDFPLKHEFNLAIAVLEQRVKISDHIRPVCLNQEAIWKFRKKDAFIAISKYSEQKFHIRNEKFRVQKPPKSVRLEDRWSLFQVANEYQVRSSEFHVCKLNCHSLTGNLFQILLLGFQ